MCRLSALLLALVLVASGKADERKSAEAPGPWGTVKGRIVWGRGDVPKPKPVDVSAAGPEARRALKGKLFSEDWVIHEKNRGIRWTFVWLAAEPGKTLPIHASLKKVPGGKVEIKQEGLRFVPHALAMRRGQPLVIRNVDDLPHGVSTGEAGLGAPLLLPKGTFECALPASAFPHYLSCGLHPWMSCRVAVFDHPYFAVTDENGAFRIPLVPAGSCRLNVWHERAAWRGGKEGQKVEVKAGRQLNFGELGLTQE